MSLLAETIDLLATLKERAKTDQKLPKGDIEKLQLVLQNPLFQHNLVIQQSLKELKHKLENLAACDLETVCDEFDINDNGYLVINEKLLQILSSNFPNHIEDTQRSSLDEKLLNIQNSNKEILGEIFPNRELKCVRLYGKEDLELGWDLIETWHRIVVVKIWPKGAIRRNCPRISEGDELLAVDQHLVFNGQWPLEKVQQYIDNKLNRQYPVHPHIESVDLLKDNTPSDVLTEDKNDGLILTLAPNETLAFDNIQDSMVDTTDPAVAAALLQLAERRRDSADNLLFSLLSGDWTQMQAIELTNDGSGLGFGIVGGRSTGVVVKTVLPGGPADKDGRLRTGDHILQIGSINLHGMSSQQVAMILRQQEGPITRLVVGRPADASSSSPHTSLRSNADEPNKDTDNRGAYTVPTKTAVDPALFDAHLVQLETDKLDLAVPNIPPGNPALLDLTSNTFCRENWAEKLTEEYEVDLTRDQQLGLGITVAGYVHKKEEICGIFVKGLVNGSAAQKDGRIEAHDLILKVNSTSLEGLSHSQSVQELVNSGLKVKLKLIRFLSGSPQAKYLDILRGQDLTDVKDSDSSEKRDMAVDNGDRQPAAVNVGLTEEQIKKKWKAAVAQDRDIIIAHVVRPEGESLASLGLSLEGTVDVVDGAETSPHHYIQSIDQGSPAEIAGTLKPGDELLEVDGISLHGQSHVDVVRILSQCKSTLVKLVVSRFVPTAQLFRPTKEHAHEPCQVMPERLVKAKSEVVLNPNWDTYELLEEVARRLRSRSLEPLNNLAVWSTTPTVIYLNKGARGLGFSVLDYQDPLHPSETVIVVRSLVPGGVASQDGRIIPGDRLLFVNERELHNADLTNAVDALKSAPKGQVKIGLAKPLPFHNEDMMQEAPMITQTERLLAKGALASPLTKRKRKERRANDNSVTPPPLPSRPPPEWTSTLSEHRKRLDPQAYYSRSYALYGSLPQSKPASTLSGSWLSMNSWSAGSSPSLSPAPSPSSLLRGSWAADIVHLPASMERAFKLKKGSEPLGVTLDPVDKAVNGCQIKTMVGNGAFAKDGRVQVGDLITKLNNETLRCVTNSQAKAVLNRTNLIYADIPVTYMSGADADKYKENVEKHPLPESPASTVNRLSPKSPYFTRKEFVPSDVDLLSDGENSCSEVLSTTADISHLTSPSEIEDAEAAATWVLSVQLVDEAIKQAVQSLTADKELLIRKILVQENIEPPQGPCPDVSSSAANNIDVDDKSVQPPQIIEHINLAPAEEKENEEPAKQKLTAKDSNVISEGASSGNSESVMSGSSTRSKYWGEPRTVMIVREPSRSLGISIVGGRVEVSQKGGLPGTGTTVSGIFIKSVLSGSPAGRCGQMSMGDRILSVNGVDLREATHEQAVEVIKSAANPIKFVLQSLHSLPSQQLASGASSPRGSAPSSAPQTPSLKRKRSDASKKVTPPPATAAPPAETECIIEIAVPGDAQSSTEATLVHTVTDAVSLATKETRTPVTPTSPPAEHPPPLNRRHTESQVIEKAVHAQAKSIAHEHEMRDARVSSMSKLNGKETGPFRPVSPISRSRVDSLSAAALKRLDDDKEKEDAFGYTQMKIGSRYMDLEGELLSVSMDRSPEGLGLSLVGNRDRSKMSVFVCGISQSGAAAKVGDRLRIGDQVLEINGIVLQGRSHLNASALIRGLKDPVIKLVSVLLRNSNAMLDMAIPHDMTNAIPTTPIPIPNRSIPTIGEEESKENEPPAPSPSSTTAVNKLPSPAQPRNVALLRGADGFGITLTEGTTTDNLRGIFVTNISPECPTAKSRSLRVGDQILAVNGQEVHDCTSTKVAQIIQSAQGQEVELTVSTHMVVPLPSTANSISRPSPVKSPETTTHNATPEDHKISTVVDVNRKQTPSATINLMTTPIVVGEETTIEIEKAGKGLGLSIVGGSDTVLGSVVIHEVYPDGAAAKDARLKPGDQVLEVNYQSLREVSHDTAISLLRQTPSRVRLLVFRDPNLQLSLLDPSQIYNVFEVELSKKPGRGLGLSIVGRKTEPGVYVSEVVKGGAAEADGRLCQGDQILAVNGQDLTAAMQEQAAAILKTCMGKVLLKIGRWKLSEGSSPTAVSTPAIPTIQNQKATSSSESSEARQQVADDSSSPMTSTPISITAPAVETTPVTKIEEEEPETEAKSTSPEGTSVEGEFKEDGSDTIVIKLEKNPDAQLGMGIGKRPRGVLVTSLQPNSQAALHLKVGDKILAVNNVGIADADQASAVRLVKESGADLLLHIARPLEQKNRSLCTIELERGADGLGFSIVGGCNSSHGDLPIFVKAVYSRGAAALQGKLKRGDQIVAVDGHTLENMSHDQAVQILKDTLGKVILEIIPAADDS